jgi:uncharacterized membrane protein
MKKNWISEGEEKALVQAIEEAERMTSGEIRIHIEAICKEDVLDRAASVFAELNMHRTQLRNGVLIYLAIDSRKFAIIGDGGINAVVPEGFWDATKYKMQEFFSRKEFAAGLIYGATEAGKHLKAHFPFQRNDNNELSNEISYGK